MASCDLLAVIWNISIDHNTLETLRGKLPFSVSEFVNNSVPCAHDGSQIFDLIEVRLPIMPAADCKENDADVLKLFVLQIRGLYRSFNDDYKVTLPFVYSTGKALNTYVKVSFNARAVESTTDFFLTWGEIDFIVSSR